MTRPAEQESRQEISTVLQLCMVLHACRTAISVRKCGLQPTTTSGQWKTIRKVKGPVPGRHPYRYVIKKLRTLRSCNSQFVTYRSQLFATRTRPAAPVYRLTVTWTDRRQRPARHARKRVDPLSPIVPSSPPGTTGRFPPGVLYGCSGTA